MKRIFLLAAVILSVLGAAFLPRLIPSAQKEEQVFSPVRYCASKLIIDAGHGGEDGGAVSLSGFKESMVNLAIARRLDQIMGLYGVPTVMLRMEDVSLHDSDASTLREKKVSDLHNRANAVNAFEDDSVFLVSIHQNSFQDPRYSGAHVFYAPTEGSQPFAEYTQEVLRVSLDPRNDRVAAPIPESVYLMNHIRCPAILVECGFLSNRAEDQLLQTPEYQLMVASALGGAYLQYQEITKDDAQWPR